MNIKEIFLQLTSKTYPHGTENELKQYLPENINTDSFGNYYLNIGNSSTMFTAHLDTKSEKQENVNHIIKDNIISTDNNTILGADNKAGVTILLNMIKNKVPGLYYFFIGEEVGCLGSKEISSDWYNNEFYNKIKRVITFDRKGYNSVITKQMYRSCCSDEFAEDLINKLSTSGLKFEKDPTGVWCDSAEFMDIIAETTNISVGYSNEHTNNESQDIEFLENLANAVCNIDWESLPTVRDIDQEDYENDTIDNEYPQEQLELETESINIWLKKTDIYPVIENVYWNGNKLYLENKESIYYIGDRKYLKKNNAIK